MRQSISCDFSEEDYGFFEVPAAMRSRSWLTNILHKIQSAPVEQADNIVYLVEDPLIKEIQSFIDSWYPKAHFCARRC